MKRTTPIILILTTFLIVNCSPQLTVESVTATATSQPAVTMTPDVKPSETATYTPNPIPFQLILPAITLSPQGAEESLLELLRTNGNCTGKCIAGIRPDEMTTQEAVNTLSQWGVVGIYHDYFGKTYISLNAPPFNDKVGVYLSIGTWTKEFETIDQVAFRIQNIEGGNIETDLWSENRSEWKGYRLDSLLKSYGIPSYVGYSFEGMSYVGAVRYFVEIQYQDLQIAIGSQSIATYDGENVFLCPAKDPQFFEMVIYPRTPLNDRKRFAPVTWQSLSGTDLEAFYQTFTDSANPDACIITNLRQIRLLQPGFHY